MYSTPILNYITTKICNGCLVVFSFFYVSKLPENVYLNIYTAEMHTHTQALYCFNYANVCVYIYI